MDLSDSKSSCTKKDVTLDKTVATISIIKKNYSLASSGLKPIDQIGSQNKVFEIEY